MLARKILKFVINSLWFFLFYFLDQKKIRRFHPLRNLRRMFRRRTITNDIGSPSNSVSEHNVRDASTVNTLTPATSTSSPASPLKLENEPELSKVTLGSGESKNACRSLVSNEFECAMSFSMSTTSAAYSSSHHHHHHHHHHQHQYHHQQLNQHQEHLSKSQTVTGGGRQSIGVAVLPTAFNNSHNGRISLSSSPSYFVKDKSIKPKGRFNDSEKDLKVDESNGSAVGGGGGGGVGAVIGNGEITDSQRSLSEGRLVDR